MPCGVFEDLSCAANRDQGNQSASLLCRGCPAPATACVFPNVSWGEHLVPKSPLGVKSGYSKVVLATPSLLPVLRACPAPDDRGTVSGTLVVAVLLVLGIMMAAVLARKRLGRSCRWNCRLRLSVRLCRKDSPLAVQKLSQVFCSLDGEFAWMLRTLPFMIHLIAQFRETFDPLSAKVLR